MSLDLQHRIPQLKEDKAVLQQRRAALQAEYDKFMEELDEGIKDIDSLIRRYSKPVPRFTVANDTVPAPTPVASISEGDKPPRKKPGPPKGFRKGIPKGPRKASAEPAVLTNGVSAPAMPAPVKTLRVDEETVIPAMATKVEEPAAPVSVPTPKVVEKVSAKKVVAQESRNTSLPPGVTIGRNGRPKLLESVAFVLHHYGPLHLDILVEKLGEHDLLPASRDARAYVSYELSKNNKNFRPLGKGQRGVWKLVPSFAAAWSKKVGTSSPSVPSEHTKAAPPPVVANDEEDEGEDDEGLEDVKSMRAAEANVSVGQDEAERIVDEMTDPDRLNGTAAA